jgi:hypothetical protein
MEKFGSFVVSDGNKVAKMFTVAADVKRFVLGLSSRVSTVT